MDFSDSDLMEELKKGRIPDSQNSEKNKTQEMSQNTIQKLMDEVISPLMSQKTEEILHTQLENDTEIQGAITEFLSKENDSFGKYFPPIMEPKQTKRRTPRIQDDFPSLLLTGLNRSFESEHNKSGLCDTSIVSFQTTTISQIQTESQPIEYLRNRTEEQQAARNKNKIAEDLAKQEQMNAINEARLEQEARNRMAENMTQRVIPIDDEEVQENSEIEEKYDMEMDVMTNRCSKMSDMAYLVTNDGEKHMWSRMGCNVPIELRWSVPSCFAEKKLWLKIRLVHYTNTTDLQSAIRNSKADVVKCRKHIEQESRFPPEAFFYVVSRGRRWQSRLNHPNGGYTHSTIIEPGVCFIEFDLIFMCQKMCMGIEDKRKSACLAAFLEDEQESEILHTVIDQVSVVAYPRRDCGNFREKLPGFKFTEIPSTRQSIKKRPHFLPSASLHQSHPKSPEVMLNLNNNYQMLPSTSNSRKRGASENIFSKPQAQHISPKPISYARRLHGCGPKNEPMDMDILETPATKRVRQIFHQHQDLRLYGKEYAKVVEFLAKEAEEETSKQPLHQYPISRLQPSDRIEKFIASVGSGNDVDRFLKAGIQTLTDLTERFEIQYEIFEWIGVDSAKLEKYYDVFLNYYRIQQRNKMRDSTTLDPSNF